MDNTIEQKSNAGVEVVDIKIEVVDAYTAKEVETKTIVNETIINLDSLAKEVTELESEIANAITYKTDEIAYKTAEISRFTELQDNIIAKKQAKLDSLQAKILDLKSKGITKKPIDVPQEININ